MAEFLTPTELSVAWSHSEREIREIARQAFIVFGREAKSAAIGYSQGPLSAKEERALGHPYATRHSARFQRSGSAGAKKGYSRDPNQAADVAAGLAGQSAGIINKHSGTFSRAWHWKTSGNVASGITGTLWNEADKNGFPYGEALFTGTRRMIARPTLADIAFESLSPKVDLEFGRVVNLIGDLFIGNVIGSSGFKKG